MLKISLKVLENFQCLGTRCPLSCCRDYSIAVDEDTIEKWKSLPDLDGKGTLYDRLTILADGSMEGCGNQLLRKGSCYMLDEDGLCRVQSAYGHDNLPRTCREHPRFNRQANQVDLRSAALSCYEISRLVLSGSTEEGIFSHRAKDIFQAGNSPVQDQNWLTRNLLAELMNLLFAAEKYPLSTRLFFMSSFFGQLLPVLKAQGCSPELAKSVKTSFKSSLFDANKAVKNRQIKIDAVTAGSFWKSVYRFSRALDSESENDHAVWKQFSEYCAQDLTDHGHYQAIYDLILEMNSTWQEMQSEEFSRLFRRYILVSFINQGFPLQPVDNNLLATLVYIMVVASSVQLALWRHVVSGSTLSRDDVIRVLSRVEHYDGQTERVYRQLVEDPHMLQIDRYASVFLDVFNHEPV